MTRYVRESRLQYRSRRQVCRERAAVYKRSGVVDEGGGQVRSKCSGLVSGRKAGAELRCGVELGADVSSAQGTQAAAGWTQKERAGGRRGEGGATFCGEHLPRYTHSADGRECACTGRSDAGRQARAISVWRAWTGSCQGGGEVCERAGDRHGYVQWALQG